MASLSQLTQELLDEFGKSSTAAQAKVETWIGEIVLELLSMNDGRFRGLRKSETVTIDTSYKTYRLPADYNSISNTFVQVDSDGEFVGKLDIVSEEEVYNRMEEGEYSGAELAYVDYLPDGRSGAGWYLILADEPTATGYYKLKYYRVPTVNDIEIIRNSNIVKMGVRGRAGEFNRDSRQHEAIYLRMKQGFVESPTRHQTAIRIRPDRRTRATNAYMHTIGRRSR